MLFSVLPFGTHTVKAAVSVPSSASVLSQRMESIVNGQYGVGKYFTTNGSACSDHNRCKTPTASEAGEAGAKQCFGYGRYVFYQLFGHSLSTTYFGERMYVLGDTTNVSQIGQTTASTSVVTKSILSKAYLGDIIQASKTTSSGQHTMVVYSVDSNGVTVLECNRDGKCGIARNTFTWSEISAKYPYFTLYRSKNHPGMYEESTKFPTPLRAYTLATGDTIVYSSIGGSAKSNKIYDTDRCTINTIYENGWCKVTFPIGSSGKTDTGYVKTAVFFNPNYETFNVTTGKKLTIYERSNLSGEIGSISAGTDAQVVGHTSKAVQILYQRSAGDYGVGWVPISVFTYTIAYNANSGSGTMTSTTAKYNGTMTLSANKFSKTGHTFKGWNVYRTSDKTWYVKGIGWKTASQISAGGYTKSVYKDELSCNFSSNWIKGSETNDTLTFYPIWEANTLSVYFHANGAGIDSDTYKLTDNIVCYKSDDSKVVNEWTYNEKRKNGLTNVTTLGLSKTGHTFAGWGTSASGGTVFNQNDTDLVPTDITSNIKAGSCKKTLYAIWKPNTYAVKYNANGGAGAPSAQTKTYGTALTLSSVVPTRNGYTFVGWGTTSTATTANYQPGGNYTSNKAITLYAVWEKSATESTHTHEWSSDYTVDIEPTCTEEGVKSIHCLSCSESTNVTTIPVIEHSLGEVILREASCASVGQKAFICSDCGAVTGQTEIPKEEHNYVSTVITESTCSQEGVKADVCSECKMQTNEQALPKEEHQFGEWTVVTEASASGDGTEKRECVKCQHEETQIIHYIPVYDENSPMIMLENIEVNSGEEVKVSIDLVNNPGICALNIAFIYDTNYITLTSVENKVSSMVMTYDTAIVWDAAEDYLSNGQLAELTFEVSETAPSGEYEIQIVFMGASNSNFKEVNLLAVSGVLSVSSIVYGDANGDKQISTVDLAMIRKYLASKNPITGESSILVQGGADCNGDGSVGTVDLAMIRKYLASKDPITGESSVVLGPQS